MRVSINSGISVLTTYETTRLSNYRDFALRRSHVLTTYETTRLSNRSSSGYQGVNVLTTYETTRLSNYIRA